MGETKPTYEELKRRCLAAESMLEAIRTGQADTVQGEKGTLVLRMAEAEERASHIKQVLLAIRNVNQLITHETNRKRLIERACANLTETLGYYNAWIALLDEAGAVTMTANEGFDGGFRVLQERLQRGEFHACMRKAVQHDEIVVTADPLTECPDCPLASEYGGRAGMTHRLAVDDRTYGILAVSVPASYAHDEEEQDLFNELIGDLAFALHKIEVEEDLVESRRRFWGIFEGSRDGFVMVDAAGRITDANQAFCEMLGYSIDELRELPDFYRITPERWRVWESEEIWQKRLLGQGYSGVYEKEYIRKDGSIFPVELQSYAVFGDDGNPKYLWGVARDITERKRSERALKESHARLDLALGGADLGTWDWNIETNEIAFDERWARMLGYTLDELEFNLDTWKNLVHPDDFPQTIRALEDHLEGKTDQYEDEHRLRHKSGEWIWILDRGKVIEWDENGKPLRACGTHLDITQSRLAQERIKQSEEKFRGVFNISPTGIAIVDTASQRFLDANDSLLRILGYSLEELQQLTVPDVTHPDDWKDEREAVQRYLDSDLPAFAYEKRYIRKDGEIRWVRVTGDLIHTAPDPSPLAIANVEDITERKHAEKALQSSEEKFSKAFRDAPVLMSISEIETGRYLDVNDAFVEVSGYSREGAIGRTSIEIGFLSLETRNRMKGILESQGYVKNLELELTRADGSELVCLYSAEIIDVAGEPRILSIATDITDRKIAELKLQESEERFRLLTEAAPMSILLLRDGKYLYGNPASARLLGYENPEEIVGINALDTVAPEYHGMVRERMARIDAGVENQPLELELLRANGERVWSLSTSVPVHMDGLPTAIVVGQDITDRKLVEDLLRETLEETRQHQRETQALLEASRAVLECGEFEHAARRIFDICCEVIGAVSGYVALMSANGEENEVLFLESGGLFCEVDPSLPMPIRGLRAEAYQRGEVVYENDFQNSKWVTNLPSGHVELRNALFAPLTIDGKVAGVMGLANKKGDFTKDDVRIAGVFGDLAAVALRRIRAEEALRENERRLEDSQKTGRIGHVEYDVEQGKILWADMVYELYERDPASGPPSYQEVMDYHHPDDAAQMGLLVKNAVEKCEPYSIDLRVCLPSGKEAIYRAIGTPYKDENGKVTRVTGTVQDITDHKKTEEALRESERKVRTKLDALLSPGEDLGVLELSDVIDVETIQSIMDQFYAVTHIGVAIVDQSGKVLVATGWQEICTRYHRCHPETVRNCIESDTALSKGAQPGEFKVYRCKNGMIDIATPMILGDRHLGNLFLGQFFFEDAPPDREVFRDQARRYGFDEESYLDALDRVPRWSGETVDHVMRFYSTFANLISNLSYGNLKLAHTLEQQRIAEEALRESENQKNLILNATTENVTYFDKEFRIIWANRTAAQSVGKRTEDLVGGHCYEIWHDKLDPCPDCPVLRARDKKMPQAGEQLTPDGHTWTIRAYPVFDGEGEVEAMVEFARDVTEKRQAERERAELEEQYRQSQKMEAVGQLAGGVAHDFNNLLQAILGYGDLALGDLDPNNPASASVSQIMKASRRAATLVSQLLAFSRRQILEMKDVELNGVIADLLKMIRRVIGEHISLDFVATPDLEYIRADRGQIEQILMNLCVNARDAMPEGGSIVIETESVEIDQSFSQSHPWAKPGRYALLSVTDTGCGIEEAMIETIFDPFFTTKGVGEGTGLGLSTVYGLVRQHEGLIHVYSEVGKGTTFKLYLPKVARANTTPIEEKTDAPPAGSETILLAEDDEMVRKLSKAILSRAGYNVLIATNGEEALRVFEEHANEIDMALLDVMMPKLGGRAVYERIRETHPHIRTLFASGYSMSSIHSNFVLEEGLALIQKPYERNVLLQKVREVLDVDREDSE